MKMISRLLAVLLLSLLVGCNGNPQASKRNLTTDLSTAQAQLAQLIADGADAQAIADARKVVQDLTPSAKRLITGADLTWLYDFALPTGGSGCSTFPFTGPGVGYNKANNSLFRCGTIANPGCNAAPMVAEISIPAAGGKSTILQAFGDPSGGLIGRFNQQGSRYGGIVPYKGRLLLAMYGYYDANNSITRALATGSLNLASPSSQGPFGLSCSVDGKAVPAGAMGGWIEPIPADWSSLFPGMTHFCGNGGIPIVGRTSLGPAAIAFNADTLADGSPATPSIFYPITHPMSLFDVTPQVWYSTVAGMADIDSSSVYGMLFIGVQPQGRTWYGLAVTDPNNPNNPRNPPPGCSGTDPCNQYEGNHAQGNINVSWVYDQNQVPTAPKSYSLTPAQANLVWPGQKICDAVLDMAHDRDNCLLYITATNKGATTVHVFGYPK